MILFQRYVVQVYCKLNYYSDLTLHLYGNEYISYSVVHPAELYEQMKNKEVAQVNYIVVRLQYNTRCPVYNCTCSIEIL